MPATPSASPTLSSPRDRINAALLALVLGWLLAAGFLSTARTLAGAVGSALGTSSGLAAELIEMACFPLLAAVFAFSLPRRPAAGLDPDFRPALSAIAPLVIAFVFGWLHPEPSIFQSPLTPAVLWYLVAVPIGEELLFRGWFYDLFERFWPERLATLTNPLPLSIWGSALGFSLWHLQNAGKMGWGLLAFQVAYTFFVGLWLGYVRRATGNVGLPIALHMAINLAAMLA